MKHHRGIGIIAAIGAISLLAVIAFAIALTGASAQGGDTKQINVVPDYVEGQISDASGRWAIVVGINDYQDESIGDLQFAVNDAKAFAARLTDPKIGNFASENVFLMTSDAAEEKLKPTLTNILKRVNALGNLKFGDTVVFYFSGHGCAKTVDGEKRNFLIPMDGDLALPERTGIDLAKDVYQKLDAITAVKRRVIIIDACRVNLEKNKGGVNTQMLEQYKFAGGTAVLMSAEFGQASYEDPDAKMGAFTRYLCEALDGAADGDGGPADKIVSFDELYKYCFEQLNGWGVRTGHAQTPMKSGEMKGDIPVSYVPGGGYEPPIVEPGAGAGEILTPPPVQPEKPVPALTTGTFKTADWSKGGRVAATVTGHSDYVDSVAFSPDGRYFATGSDDSTAKLWSVPDGKFIVTLSGHSSFVNSVAFSPDGQYLATGCWDNTAKLWTVPDGKCVDTLSGHSDAVCSVAFSPDGRWLATGSYDRTAKLWSVPDGKCVVTLSGHTNTISSVAFSPDGRYLATGSWDNTARVWHPDGNCVATLSGHTDAVESVAFSLDGLYLATGSADNAAKLWSIPDGNCIATLSGHSKGVTSAAFSPDGCYLATGSFDDTARLWEPAG